MRAVRLTGARNAGRCESQSAKVSGPMRKALNFRTGRVVAIVRTGLALALLATSWTGSGERSSGDTSTELLAGGYVLLSLIMLAVTLFSWWLTHRLRLASLMLDAAVLFAALALPGVLSVASAGVCMALFAFIMLSAAIGWPRRGAPVAALVLVAGCTGAAITAPASAGLPGWFAPQLMAMIPLAGLVIWLGERIGKARPPRLELPHEGGWPAAFAAVLDFAREQTEAQGAAAVWVPNDEPWAWVQSGGTLGAEQDRLGPDQFALPDADSAGAVLFDRVRQRQLQLLDSGAVTARKAPLEHPLPARFTVDGGIVVAVPAQGGTCMLLLTGIDDVASDHLRLARAAGIEIGHALDRRAIMVVTREADRIRIRDALARDLHDSVAQSLAGASFRIEALRQALAGGRAIGDDLDALQHSLEREERNVQRLIRQLRDRDEPDRLCDLATELAATLDDSGARWGVECGLTVDGALPPVPLLALHEFEQVLREAVANAVRHGDARRIDVRLHRGEGEILLDIVDDGLGFPTRPRPLQPRSIAARVADLGGRLDIESQPGRTALRIALPAERAS